MVLRVSTDINKLASYLNFGQQKSLPIKVLLAGIIHKNVSRHRSLPPVTATSRRSMSNISYSLIDQALVVSSSNGRDRSSARLMKEGEFET